MLLPRPAAGQTRPPARRICDAPRMEPSGDGRPRHGRQQTGAAQSVRASCDVWPAAGLGRNRAVMRSRRLSIARLARTLPGYDTSELVAGGVLAPSASGFELGGEASRSAMPRMQWGYVFDGDCRTKNLPARIARRASISSSRTAAPGSQLKARRACPGSSSFGSSTHETAMMLPSPATTF